jgi:hypothetical protein
VTIHKREKDKKMKTQTHLQSETDRTGGINDSRSSTRPGSGVVSSDEPSACALGDALMTASNGLIQLIEVIAGLCHSSIEWEAFAGATLRKELERSCEDLLRCLSPLLEQFVARTVRPSAELRCWDERGDDYLPF